MLFGETDGFIVIQSYSPDQRDIMNMKRFFSFPCVETYGVEVEGEAGDALV